VLNTGGRLFGHFVSRWLLQPCSTLLTVDESLCLCVLRFLLLPAALEQVRGGDRGGGARSVVRHDW